MKKLLPVMIAALSCVLISGKAMAADPVIPQAQQKSIPGANKLPVEKPPTNKVPPATTTTTTTATTPACTYDFSPAKNTMFTPTSTNGSQTINVLTQGGCKWNASSNAPSWLTITSGAAGTGNGSVQASWTTNDACVGRAGTLTIAGQGFHVGQKDAPGDLMLKTTQQSFSAAGGPGTVDISAPKQCGTAWTATSSDPTWLSTPSAQTRINPDGTGKITYSVSPNTGAAPREGIITMVYKVPIMRQDVGNGSYAIVGLGPAILKQFTVKQAAQGK